MANGLSGYTAYKSARKELINCFLETAPGCQNIKLFVDRLSNLLNSREKKVMGQYVYD